MRFSKLFNYTLRETPADAEIPSHKLLVRAGFITKSGSGIYSYNPLFTRTLQKAAAIVKEEIERGGGQEVILPILHEKEIWEETDRFEAWNQAGNLFTTKDRKGNVFALAPTAEEAVTDLVRKNIKSYKQLPVNVFQQHTKFRNEIRPRYGLMRVKEFVMMDAYSFDRNEAGLDESYNAMSEAYKRIFNRCGLDFIVVDADSGAIGGSGSQEFMVVADSGEDTILICENCDYSANVEKASSVLPNGVPGGEAQPMRQEDTPDIRSVEDLCKHFSMSASRMVKTVLFTAVYTDREETVAVLMRGDLEINDVKLLNELGAVAVRLADDETVQKVTGAEVGFAGPVGLEGVRILADLSVQGMTNVLCGANKTDVHNLDVNYGRDFPEPEFFDLRNAGENETCGGCKQGLLYEKKGIEVGHIFKLGTKYSEAMKCEFVDEDGKTKPMIMGCYGIGTSRLVAAAVEQNFDDKGIVWPLALAPYQVVLVSAGKGEDIAQTAEDLYGKMQTVGIEVLLDDRPGSPGVKFKDAELIGFPLRVVVGKKLAEGKVEVEVRSSGERMDVAVDKVVDTLREKIEALS